MCLDECRQIQDVPLIFVVTCFAAGNCYDKVRKETEEMRMTMNKDDRDYNAPLTEVTYIYKGEERNDETHGTKYIVEVDKTRPEWFSKFLLTKALKRQ